MRTWRHWFAPDRPTPMALADGYERWATNYPARAHNPLMAVEQAAIVGLLSRQKPRSALDVGAGTGRGLALLRQAGARRAVGVDLSLAMLAHGDERRRSVCADACALPFAGRTFDLVLSSLMVGDVGPLRPWAAEMSRVLAAGGRLVYSDFHPAWAERRWRRTFRDDRGRQFELPYHPHAIADHLEALAVTGFEVRTIREPRIESLAAPVVIVIEAVRIA